MSISTQTKAEARFIPKQILLPTQPPTQAITQPTFQTKSEGKLKWIISWNSITRRWLSWKLFDLTQEFVKTTSRRQAQPQLISTSTQLKVTELGTTQLKHVFWYFYNIHISLETEMLLIKVRGYGWKIVHKSCEYYQEVLNRSCELLLCYLVNKSFEKKLEKVVKEIVKKICDGKLWA